MSRTVHFQHSDSNGAEVAGRHGKNTVACFELVDLLLPMLLVDAVAFDQVGHSFMRGKKGSTIGIKVFCPTLMIY